MVVVSGILLLCAQAKSAKPAFTFAGVEYVARFTRNNLREFTPKDQSDLTKFTDMITINEYAKVKDGEALAKTANAVLETYEKNKAFKVKTSSVPRTPTKPAEHLVVVMFQRDNFLETSFARFVMVNGMGHSVVFSHRIYGSDPHKDMGKWLKENGDKREKDLMSFVVPKR